MRAKRLEKTPGGRPTGLAEASMPAADGIVFVSPHPGQGQILLKCIDPSVTDERDALSVDPALDFLDPANGYRDGPEGSRYSPDFVSAIPEGAVRSGRAARQGGARDDRRAAVGAKTCEDLAARPPIAARARIPR